MATDLGNAKIKLDDNFQFKLFTDRMAKITRRQSQLSNFDSAFFTDLQRMYDSAGRGLQLTRKQMNYLGDVAASVGA